MRAEPKADGVALARSASGRFRMPDFFIVGHAKCGTTALYFLLNSHAGTHMPVKEPRFFCPDLNTRYWRPSYSRANHPRTLDGYLSLFARARPDQLVGEASSSYLRSEVAAELIATVAPRARIIAILREPVAFLRSFHLQSVRNYDETEKDFCRAMALEPERRAGRRVPRFSQSPASLLYSDHIRYTEQIRRFHEAFGHDQVKVLVYDDFRSDNEGTARDLLRFLELEETVQLPPAEVSTVKTVRSVTLDQASRAVAHAQLRLRGGRQSKRRREGRPSSRLQGAWERVLYTERAAPSKECVRELRRSFKPQVEEISDYLERDLVSLWGYRDL
jgi:hypothetical protein